MMQSQQHFRTVVPRVRGRDDGCCGISFLKAALYVFNCFFWCSGLTVGALGVYTLIMKYDFAYILPNYFYHIITYSLIGICAVVMLVGIFGCWAAMTERRKCLLFFCVCLAIVLFLEVACGAVAYYYDTSIEKQLASFVKETMQKNYFDDEKANSAINKMQEQFRCCGATNYHDWEPSFEKKRNENPNFTNLVPDSCCITVQDKCGGDNHPSNIYIQGCVTELGTYIRDHLLIIIGIGLGVSLLQLVGLVVASLLAKKLKKFQVNGHTNSFKNQPNEWMLH